MSDRSSAARTPTEPHTQRVELGLLHREAHVLPSTVNADKRTAEVTWSTGARVKRSSFFDDDFYEELSLDPKHVRMERLNNGAPLLDSHQRFELGHVLGVVEKAWLTNGEGRARVRFSERAAVADIWKDVQSGVIRNISVGYRVHKFEDATKENTKDNLKLLRAVDWEPMELSAVPIGADAAAQFRADGAGDTNPCVIITREDPNMENTAVLSGAAAERIRALTKRVGLDAQFADELIGRADITEQEARAAITDRLAEQEPPVTRNINLSITGGNANGYDDPSFTREATAEAICARYTGAALSERAKPFAYRRMVDHAREALQAAGHHVGVMSEGNIITRALHTTADYPDLLTSTANRLLLDGYQAVPSGMKQVALASEARDFRPVTVLRLGPYPTLERVNEHGEVKSGTIAQTKEAYQLATYGRIFGITRQALINDDLSAFSDLARRYGAAVANLEAKILADLIISNPLLDDGVATFHCHPRQPGGKRRRDRGRQPGCRQTRHAHPEGFGQDHHYQSSAGLPAGAGGQGDRRHANHQQHDGCGQGHRREPVQQPDPGGRSAA
ncbi:MAG: prohead protease/major capsid protein fusion protein [Gammaproteobacteria bacterium]